MAREHPDDEGLAGEVEYLRQRVRELETELLHIKRGSAEVPQEREEQYRRLFEDAGVGVGYYTPEGVVIAFNKVAAAHMGGSPGDFVGKSLQDLFGERVGAIYQARIREVARSEQGQTYEDAVSLPVGDMYFRSLYAAIRDASGKVVGVQVVASDITEQKRAEEALAAYRKQLQSLASELAQSEDRERRRIAVYLHDQVGQSLAAVRVKFAAWKGMNSSPVRSMLLSEIEQLIDGTIEQTRSLTFELSPPILFELGLGPALEWMGESICEKEGIEFTFMDEGRCGEMEEVLASALYRMARELLLNAVKHAQATRVSILVSGDDDEVRLTVRDDGIGMDRSRYEQALRGVTRTYGLFSIRERLYHLGGSLQIESDPNEGTRVTVAMPLLRSVPSGNGGLA